MGTQKTTAYQSKGFPYMSEPCDIYTGLIFRSLGQAWIIPVQDAMRYFGYHFLPTNEDSRIISTEIISQQKEKQISSDHLPKVINFYSAFKS